MNQRSKKLFKNLGILTISNFASKIMVFLLVPLYTSVLSTEEYGTYDLIVSTVLLLYPILSWNIVDAVMRFSMDRTCDIDTVVAIGIKYISISVAIGGLGLLGIRCLGWVPDIYGLESLIFLYYLGYVLNQFFIQLAKGLERIKDMGIAGVLSTVVMLAGNILFLLVLHLGLAGFLWANILAQMFPVVYYIIRLKFWKYLKWRRGNRLLETQMLVYCVPLLFSALGWWINSAADKYIVAWICGTAANGLLAISYKIPSILNTLQGIFMQAWQITAIKSHEEEEVDIYYGKMFVGTNFLMCVACSVLIVLSKFLACILYANEFYSAWEYVPFLLISSVVNTASGFLGPILSAKKDSASMALSSIFGSGANIIMNIVLVRMIGIQGATIATAISSFVIYYVRKQAAKAYIRIPHYEKVLLCWGILAVQAVVEIRTTWYAMELLLLSVLILTNLDVAKRMLTPFIGRMTDRKGK